MQCKTMPNLDLVILIDAENVPARYYRTLRLLTDKLGRATTCRAFGDFTAPAMADWLKLAKAEAIEVVTQIPSLHGKNAADIQITVHAMDVLHACAADAICLVSGDGDFAALVHRLKAARMKVFGFGASNSAASLKKLCDTFSRLDEEDEKTSSAPQVAVSGNQVVATLGKVIDRHGTDGWINIGRAGAVLHLEHREIAAQFCGKGKFLQNVRQTGRFREKGSGSAIQIALA